MSVRVDEYLKPESLVCDGMFELEKYVMKTGRQSSFFIKKRFWLDPMEPMKTETEENLLMYQVSAESSSNENKKVNVNKYSRQSTTSDPADIQSLRT
jgi:hypothetical protein